MKVLVTGGGGFLGGAIARRLRERGDDVVVFGRSKYPHLRKLDIRSVRGDVRDVEAVRSACIGFDAVCHVAAKVGIWGRRRDFYEINVLGTRNVIEACRRSGVGRLVYTSSPSVVVGEEGLAGADESQPYPTRYLADYPATKAAAEQAVLAANNPDFSTAALRPHLIWGPGDSQLIPRVLERARRGRLVQVGDGTNLVDITYIDNAAAAHVAALDHLTHDAACAGSAYFISQGEPVSLWGWINELLARVGVPAVGKRISFEAARRIGALLEAGYAMLRLRAEPAMTRFLAAQLAKPHYFSIAAARRDLGYAPLVSADEGLDRLVAWIKEGEQ